MYSQPIREQAIALCASGLSVSAISRQLTVSRSAVREWTRDPGRAFAAAARPSCFVCGPSVCLVPDSYAYLLGQYLGDGYLATTARVPRLRIACADIYPGIAAEVDAALHSVSGNRPGSVQAAGCSDRGAYWMHWPCVLPQHGPGRKHDRPIVLAPWQDEIVAAHPWALIRGLIHSDGCRALNKVTIRGKTYRYVRYFFANESRDILAIMGSALDLVGVEWRYNRPNSISVARNESVAAMEARVGAKT